jgi:hypothetical protein
MKTFLPFLFNPKPKLCQIFSAMTVISRLLDELSRVIGLLRPWSGRISAFHSAIFGLGGG